LPCMLDPVMSGCSTLKRPLEVKEDEDSQSEYYRLNLKRYQHDVFARSVSASRSSSHSSYGRASSVKILGDVEEVFVGSDERVVEPLQRNCKLWIPYPGPLADMRRPPALVRSAKHL
jgi:hypothetical protein